MFRALIVDDHDEFRAKVSAVLRSRFPLVFVDEAGDGVAALRKLRSSAPDLVLLDIKLPGVSGIELVKSIKVRPECTAVAVLTGYDLAQYREAALRSGADCYLHKGSPSCMTDVLSWVEREILSRQKTAQAHRLAVSRERLLPRAHLTIGKK